MSLRPPLNGSGAARQRVPVIVEVARGANQLSAITLERLEHELNKCISVLPPMRTGPLPLAPSIKPYVLSMRCEVMDDEHEGDAVDPDHAHLILHIYTLHTEDEESEELEPDGEDSGEAPVSAGTSCTLPHERLDQLFENLFYDYRTKNSVLDYASAALRFALCGVPSEIVSCNRLILLHGPPGTGKTTFAKAIAQKLSIRMGKEYKRSKFLELNSHSLFSKWFSESGKLVMKLFEKIRDEVQGDKDMLYTILIDEVESIASSRSHGGSDPQDAVRAGNAVLTQLDRLKRYPNVLVLCTSNLTEMIDDAFSDRVDLKQYIGPPNVSHLRSDDTLIDLEARYEILRSQVEAMLKPPRAGAASLLRDDLGLHLPLPSFKQLAAETAAAGAPHANGNAATAQPTSATTQQLQTTVACQIREIACESESCGGRILRRAPLRCYSLFLTQQRGRQSVLGLSQFLSSLSAAIQLERGECQRMRPSAISSESLASVTAAASSQVPADSTSLALAAVTMKDE